MTKLIVKTRAGTEETFQADAGRSVMEVIRDSDIDELAALCGGSCSCATCHVYVSPVYLERLPAPSEIEEDLLSGQTHRMGNLRLSCQIVLDQELESIEVVIAPED